MVKKYRKKNSCYEAVQFTRNNWDEVVLFTDNMAHTLMIEKSPNGIATCIVPASGGRYIAVENDYIMKSNHGGFYLYSQEIFENTYELVEDA